MLSSLIGTSGPSYLLNDGYRKNKGEKYPNRPHQERVIMIGLVHARFAVSGQMDYALCGIPTHRLPFQQDRRLTKFFRDWLLPNRPTPSMSDRPLYRARMRISIEMALLAADDGAATAVTTARIFLAGLGLGVWRYHDSQIGLWYCEIADCLEMIDLAHVTTVEIGWNACPLAERDILLKTERNTGIKIIVGTREPACRILDTDELLVESGPGIRIRFQENISKSMESYDCRSRPLTFRAGNEYWMQSLSTSDDPAAACYSTIAELHNPYVNPFEHRVKVLQEQDFEIQRPQTEEQGTQTGLMTVDDVFDYTRTWIERAEHRHSYANRGSSTRY